MKKIHRFIGKFDLAADRLLLREPALIHQLRTVLKLRSGETIILADGSGQEALAKLVKLEAGGVEVALTSRQAASEPARRITLYCAVLKRENFEYAVEKA